MKLRPFELTLVIIFVVLCAVALVLLATFESSSQAEEDAVGLVTIWGVLDERVVNEIIEELNDFDSTYDNVAYFELSPDVFSLTLTNAIADGVGPDVVLMSHEQLVELRRRIAPVSYESYPLRDIRSQYIDGAEIFALTDGLYAYPVAVDPLMMFWNRDTLTNQGFLGAPETWEDLVNVYAPRFIERDFDRTIMRSVAALGEYGNINNAFGALSMLLIQGGSRLVEDTPGEYEVRLNAGVQGGQPLTNATDFYTRFAQPSNTLYNWNRTLPNDRQQFIAEDLALYFGYGSEGRILEALNPNLNFDIAEVPQGQTASVRRTYGQFYGLARVRTTDNPRGAAIVMSMLASPENARRIAEANNMAPVYRQTLGAGSNDNYGRLYYRSAAISYGWLNPPRDETDEIFETMVRDVLENRSSPSQSAGDAIERFTLSYN